MSHQPERKEKDCLNCGTEVLGSYCQKCGQHNSVWHQTFGQLLTHFVYDVLHFDGKFFETLKYLLLRPGFVPKAYVQGRRSSYLDPIRMYLFTSALFFLVYFSLADAGTAFINFQDSDVPLSAEDRAEAAAGVKAALDENPDDTALLSRLNQLEDSTKTIRPSDLFTGKSKLFIGPDSISTVQQYDSLQNTLPRHQRDGWLKRNLQKRFMELNAKYGLNWKEGLKDFVELFVHKLSYLLFASLPFFALLLKLLYVRRQSYYYSDHAVFTLYHYIFTFILLLLVILFSALSNWTHLKLFQNLIPYLFIAWAVYLYIAMKRFYGQGWFKTFSKFLLLNLLGIIVLLLLFVIFLFFTFFQL